MKKSNWLLVMALLSSALVRAQEGNTSSQSKDTIQPKAKNLQEVVVTALGIPRQKRSLGYSTQNIDGRFLNQGANPNLATALQGKISGLEIRPSSGMPGASALVVLRGSRFFDQNNAPLYVIDGLPINSEPDFPVNDFGVTGTDYSGRSIDLNPGDIESINVLKGQAASALYGMRASNGAIIITTKKGRKQQNGKPLVAFSTSWQIDNISRLPDFQTKYAQGSLDADPSSPTFNTLLHNHFTYYSWGPEISTLADDPNYGGNVPNDYNNSTPDASTMGKYWSPQKQAWVEPKAYDNAREFFQTGLTATNSISISQATDLSNYYIGISNTNQKGIIPSSGMDRFTLKFSGDINASAKVKTGINAFYSNTSIDKIPTGNNSILYTVYGAPASYDLKGTPISETDNPYKQLGYRDGFDNPYWATKYNSFNEKTRRFLGNTYLSYNPVSNVNIRYQLGTDQYTTDFDEYYELGSVATSPFAATLSPDNPSFSTPSGGSIMNRTFTNTTLNSLLTITYNKRINKDWGLNFLLGNELNDSKQRDITIRGLDLTAGGVHNILNAYARTSSEDKERSRTVGFFANAEIDWRNMLFLNLTGRNDYVSTMPSNNRSYFYPSASLSWIFTELNSLKDKNFSGKLRVSYAEVGAPGVFKNRMYIPHVSSSGSLTDGIQFPFAGVLGYRPNTVLYDSSMTPQNTISFEIGTELRFFNNRVGIDYSYVKQNTVDQIYNIPLAASTGFSEIVMNGGEMSSRIHELTLLLTPVRHRNFEWDVTTNFTKVINRVVSLAPGVESVFLGGFTDPQVRASIGYSYPVIYGSSYARTAEGQVIIDDDINSPTYGMPLIEQGDGKVLGSVTPKFTLGINNSFRYKFLRLSALIDWKNGGQMFSGANRLLNRYGVSSITANREIDQLTLKGVKASTVDVDNKGGEANDIVITGSGRFQDYYEYLFGSNIAEAAIYGTSFVKLREVALSVDIPAAILKPLRFISSASFSVSARNILLWTELPNFDPESSQGNGNMQGGFDYMSLPQTRSIGVGLNLTF